LYPVLTKVLAKNAPHIKALISDYKVKHHRYPVAVNVKNVTIKKTKT
jgi:hypothetical protein